MTLSSNKTMIQNIPLVKLLPFSMFRGSNCWTGQHNRQIRLKMWSILDQNVDKGDITNKMKLFEAFEGAGENEQQYIRNLVESIPRCLQTIIKAKGGHTKY